MVIIKQNAVNCQINIIPQKVIILMHLHPFLVLIREKKQQTKKKERKQT